MFIFTLVYHKSCQETHVFWEDIYFCSVYHIFTYISLDFCHIFIYKFSQIGVGGLNISYACIIVWVVFNSFHFLFEWTVINSTVEFRVFFHSAWNVYCSACEMKCFKLFWNACLRFLWKTVNIDDVMFRSFSLYGGYIFTPHFLWLLFC